MIATVRRCTWRSSRSSSPRQWSSTQKRKPPQHAAAARVGHATDADKRVDGGPRASSPWTLACRAPKREDRRGLGEPDCGVRAARSASPEQGGPSRRRRIGGVAPTRHKTATRAGKSLCGRWPRPTGRAATGVGRDGDTPPAGRATRDCRGCEQKDFPAREAAPQGRPEAGGSPQGSTATAGARACGREGEQEGRPAPTDGEAGASSAGRRSRPSVLATPNLHALLIATRQERMPERVADPYRFPLNSRRVRS